MSSPARPYDLIATELRGLAESEGAELWRNRIRLTGLLLDAQPDLRREIRSVVSAVEQDVAQALSNTERSLSGIAIDRQASLLETESGLRPEIALNVTRTIAHALNLGPLPSVYGHAAPQPPMAPPPAPPRLDRPVHASIPQAPPIPTHQPPPPQQHWSDPRASHGHSAPNPGAKPFPWAIVIVGSALLIGGGVLTATLVPRGGSGNVVAGGTTPTPTPAPTPTPTPTPPADAIASLQPGQWEYVTTPTRLDAPGANPEALEKMRAGLSAQRVTECLDAANARITGQQLATAFAQGIGQGATCTIEREEIGNGSMMVTGQCRAPAFNVNLVLQGGYTGTTADFDTAATINNGQQIISVTSNTAARRLGECTGG